MEGHLT